MNNEDRDMDLILPGRPVEITPVQVQLAPSPPAALPVAPPSGGLLDYVSVFRRNARLILCAALGTALLGYLSTVPLKPVYRARATLEIQNPNDNFMNVGELDPSATVNSAETYVETQARILQDDALVERMEAIIIEQTAPARQERALEPSYLPELPSGA